MIGSLPQIEHLVANRISSHQRGCSICGKQISASQQATSFFSPQLSSFRYCHFHGYDFLASIIARRDGLPYTCIKIFPKKNKWMMLLLPGSFENNIDNLNSIY